MIITVMHNGQPPPNPHEGMIYRDACSNNHYIYSYANWLHVSSIDGDSVVTYDIVMTDHINDLLEI